jgi:glycosyltransferase involved in cell wall biosynthesis
VAGVAEYGLVSLQRDYWDSPWQNRQAMMSAFARLAPVLFLGPPFELGELIDRTTYRRTTSHGRQRIADQLHAFTPPRFLPTSQRFAALDRASRRALRALVRKELGRLGIERPVAYVWHPAAAAHLDLVDPALVVYHKYDHYQGYGGAADGPDPAEAALIARADAFLVTSAGLLDMHVAQRPDVALVPNGVDYELFADAASRGVLPGDLEKVPAPRVGYVGVVNEKVDFELLDALAARRPEWSIVLVGPDRVREPEFRARLEALRRRPNCYILGEKAAADVPPYVAGLDVCLMSYLVNGWTFYGYPLKMHEYLAAGRPSVATDLPAIREFRDVVRIAHDVDDWEAAIAEALAGSGDREAGARRQAVARANSWTERTRVVDAIIRRCLPRAAPRP